MSPATDNQKRKLERCYRTFGFDSRGLNALSKLEASTMIDAKMEMDQKASYVKAFKIGECQRQSARDKKLLAFREMEEQEQKELQEGRDAFPAFLEALELAYSRRDAEIQQAREQAAAAREQQEIERGYFEVAITVTAYSGSVTPRQEGFLQSLVNQASGHGYLFRGRLCGRCHTKTEASLMIETLLSLNRRPGRKEGVLVFDTAGILQEVGRVAGCEEGSVQILKLAFTVQDGEGHRRG